MTKKPPAEPVLETFIPADSFEGYPFDPKGSPVIFTKGVESKLVPADYVALLREKNLVADKSAKTGAEEKPEV